MIKVIYFLSSIFIEDVAIVFKCYLNKFKIISKASNKNPKSK